MGRGWLPIPKNPIPRSRPFGPRLSYPHSKISSDAVGLGLPLGGGHAPPYSAWEDVFRAFVYYKSNNFATSAALARWYALYRVPFLYARYHLFAVVGLFVYLYAQLSTVALMSQLANP